MSVIVKCERPKSHRAKASSCQRLICQPPCPPRPPCQSAVQIIPCQSTFVRCTMIQGGILWNGVTKLPCIVYPPSPPCYYVPCCPNSSC